MYTKKHVTKSIKTDLIMFSVSAIIAVIFFLSSVSVYFIYTSTEQALIKSVKEASELVSQKVTDEIEKYSIIADSIGVFDTSPLVFNGSTEKFLNEMTQKHNIISVDIVKSDGKSKFQNIQYSDNQSYKKSKADNKPFLSDPIVDGESVHFEYAYPFEDIMIIMYLPYEAIGNITKDVKMGSTGSTYILNSEGAKVAHDDFSLVLKHQNNLEEVKKDPKTYKTVAALETRMVKGESDFGFYTWRGDRKFGSFNPIKNTNGWSINVTALSKEFLAGVRNSLIYTFIIAIILLILSIICVAKIANTIINPINLVADAILKMRNGNLDIGIDVKRHDEVGIMAENMNWLGKTFRDIISDISNLLSELSDGNLDIESKMEYLGEFRQIRNAIDNIIKNLNSTIHKLNLSSKEVSNSSNQVSMAAQTLSEGTMEQTNSIKRLLSTIEDIYNHIKIASQNAENANQKTLKTGNEASICNKQMNKMIAAMSEIAEKSNQIDNIVKIIEDISSQTNLLALNAAIEAARAGDSGKGFAVVADEIRNLANESAKATKDITALVESSISSVKNGTEIADETAKELTVVVKGTEDVVNLVDTISKASKEQENAIDMFANEIEQISSIVESTFSNAQESASTSEELSRQAEILKSLVEKFRLKSNN